MASKLIIFVCTSNTCRSPMSESMAKHWLANHGIDPGAYRVVSRSITEDYEPEGSPASENGVMVLRNEFGLDISNHRSCLIRQADVQDAFCIVGVTRSHAEHIKRLFPQYTCKVTSLPSDVSDPWHGPYEEYLNCARVMHNLVASKMHQIVNSAK